MNKVIRPFSKEVTDAKAFKRKIDAVAQKSFKPNAAPSQIISKPKNNSVLDADNLRRLNKKVVKL